MARILIGNIKGPKGDTGARGATGATGPVGPQGPLPPLINNGLATQAGVAALDAVMGKTLTDGLTQLNRDFSNSFKDLSALTLDELLSGNPNYKIPRLGFIAWDSSIAPDANTTFVEYVKGGAVAHSLSGKMFELSSASTGWVQKNASKDDIVDNAPDFTASETLLAWANAATRNTSKCIKSGIYPSDAPSTSGEWIAEVIITQWRRIVRVTGYNTSTPTIYIRSIFNNTWQSGWAQK